MRILTLKGLDSSTAGWGEFNLPRNPFAPPTGRWAFLEPPDLTGAKPPISRLQVELVCKKILVELVFQKLLVGAFVDDPSFINNHNRVGNED